MASGDTLPKRYSTVRCFGTFNRVIEMPPQQKSYVNERYDFWHRQDGKTKTSHTLILCSVLLDISNNLTTGSDKCRARTPQRTYVTQTIRNSKKSKKETK